MPRSREWPMAVLLKLGIARVTVSGLPVEIVIVEGCVISGFVARLLVLA